LAARTRLRPGELETITDGLPSIIGIGRNSKLSRTRLGLSRRIPRTTTCPETLPVDAASILSLASAAEKIVRGYRSAGSSGPITPREREIAQLVAEGRSNKEIAAALEISVKTVETHRAHIMDKLDLHSIPELVRSAIWNRIIQSCQPVSAHDEVFKQRVREPRSLGGLYGIAFPTRAKHKGMTMTRSWESRQGKYGVEFAGDALYSSPRFVNSQTSVAFLASSVRMWL